MGAVWYLNHLLELFLSFLVLRKKNKLGSKFAQHKQTQKFIWVFVDLDELADLVHMD